MSILADRWGQAAYTFAVLFGVFAFPLYSLSAAHMNDSVEPGGFVEAASGLLLLYAAGAVLGPLMASSTMLLAGPKGLFLYTAVVHAVMVLFATHRLRRSVRPTEEAREPFMDSVRVAQTVAPLDPLVAQPAATPEE